MSLDNKTQCHSIVDQARSLQESVLATELSTKKSFETETDRENVQRTSNSPQLHSSRLYSAAFDSINLESEDLKEVISTHRNSPYSCHGCGRPITDRYLLKAVDRYWHEACLKCSCCNCQLDILGCTLFTRGGLLLCRRDYLRLFGETGSCYICSQQIPPLEMVMRVKDNVYHLQCFACQRCHQRFCIGDKYYFHDNMIICEYDYEKININSTSTISYHSRSSDEKDPSAVLKKVITDKPDQPCTRDDLSSGYGSPFTSVAQW